MLGEFVYQFFSSSKPVRKLREELFQVPSRIVVHVRSQSGSPVRTHAHSVGQGSHHPRRMDHMRVRPNQDPDKWDAVPHLSSFHDHA